MNHTKIQWYCMRAHHINEGKAATITQIAAEDENCTVLVVQTGLGADKRNKFIVTGTDTFVIGQQATWINDTGNGYRQAPYGHEIMMIVNIIEIDGGKVTSSVNAIGIDGLRKDRALSTVVFK